MIIYGVYCIACLCMHLPLYLRSFFFSTYNQIGSNKFYSLITTKNKIQSYYQIISNNRMVLFSHTFIILWLSIFWWLVGPLLFICIFFNVNFYLFIWTRGSIYHKRHYGDFAQYWFVYFIKEMYVFSKELSNSLKKSGLCFKNVCFFKRVV